MSDSKQVPLARTSIGRIADALVACGNIGPLDGARAELEALGISVADVSDRHLRDVSLLLNLIEESLLGNGEPKEIAMSKIEPAVASVDGRERKQQKYRYALECVESALDIWELQDLADAERDSLREAAVAMLLGMLRRIDDAFDQLKHTVILGEFRQRESANVGAIRITARFACHVGAWGFNDEEKAYKSIHKAAMEKSV